MDQLRESSKTETQTTMSAELKGKRLGRGQVETGLTHECGVFGVVGTGEWPTNVSLNSIYHSYKFLIDLSRSSMSHKFAVLDLSRSNTGDKVS